MTNLKIRTGTWQDEPKIGALMALAFASDPFVRWLLPDAHDYLRSSEKHAGLSSGPAFDKGTVFVIGDVIGAAIWLPPGFKISREHENASDEKDTRVAPPDEFEELIEKSAAYCPDYPHWYLSFIVVDPAQSGQGLGSILLAHTLARCDRDQVPAYLESTNGANLSIYERHGFKLLAEVTVGGSPARYPMIRDPQ